MSTLIREQFRNNSEVTMDKEDDKLYVFAWIEGKYDGVSQYDCNIHGMAMAVAQFQSKTRQILEKLADEIE